MSNSHLKVALVSMPWAAFGRPSVQLGTLKSYLATDPAITVTSFHPYLEVSRQLGEKTYHSISLQSWTCEALYSSLLFPEKREGCKNVVAEDCKEKRLKLDFHSVVALLETHLQEWVESISWDDFDLVGFSVCFNQLTSSLAAASELKKKYPALKIVFGGSSCIAEMTAGLFHHFPIDYLISGEGEEPLLHLCKSLMGKTAHHHPRVYLRDNHKVTNDVADSQVEINRLPLPDYDDYFKEIQAIYRGHPFIPTLPIEFSRGCWWGKCVFCNLNLQWKGYRFKTVDKMVNEVEELVEKYGSLNLTFTDNVLPFKEALQFFRHKAIRSKDIEFFGEMRANQKGDYLHSCKKGGLTSIQVGIEALSESLLKRMRKGAAVIENIAIMRDAIEYGVILDGNLITEFPGSTCDEVTETLDVLDFVFPYRPLSTASFFLGHGSPVAADCQHYGISAIFAHYKAKKMFPENITKELSGLVKGYRGDKQQQRKIWLPVKEKVKKWHDFHAKRKIDSKPLLSFRDSGRFLLIRQELPDGQVHHHRLRGLSRDIYLACRAINTLSGLLLSFPTITKGKLLPFIDELTQKKIMFCQDEKVLSLAVSSLRR